MAHHGSSATSDLIHGVGATAVAFSVPDGVIAFGEKWLYAVGVAVASTLMSKAVAAMWERVGSKKP